MLYTEIEELEMNLNAALWKALKSNQRVLYAVGIPTRDYSVLYLNDTISISEVVIDSLTFDTPSPTADDDDSQDSQQSFTLVAHDTSTEPKPYSVGKFNRIISTVFTDIEGVYQDDITYTEMSKTVAVNSQNSVSYFIVASREDAELYRKQYIKYLITIYSDAIDRLTKSIQ